MIDYNIWKHIHFELNFKAVDLWKDIHAVEAFTKTRVHGPQILNDMEKVLYKRFRFVIKKAKLEVEFIKQNGGRRNDGK